MPTVLSGVVSEGYTVIAEVPISQYGYGFCILSPPSLPLNPYYGYVYAVNLDNSTGGRFACDGKKVYRDGAQLFVPFADSTYQVICIFSGNGIGLTWLFQY